MFRLKYSKTIETLTKAQVLARMDEIAAQHFKMSAKKALKKIEAGELPDTLSASRLRMLESLIRPYGDKK